MATAVEGVGPVGLLLLLLLLLLLVVVGVAELPLNELCLATTAITGGRSAEMMTFMMLCIEFIPTNV